MGVSLVYGPGLARYCTFLVTFMTGLKQSESMQDGTLILCSGGLASRLWELIINKDSVGIDRIHLVALAASLHLNSTT